MQETCLEQIGKINLIILIYIKKKYSREERDRLRIQKLDPLNHMSKCVDDLKRKREDENKSLSSNSTKKTSALSTSSSSSSSSTTSRIEQLRADR